ncbi:MAG: 3-oxoacyl-ACP reductase FabG [Nitrososphaerota archaeon]|nr:3-oxoacyl-ACP reductase FabG [Nitrososphaerota archaeon]
MRLSGRVAIVTGASRGIGYAIAKRFAAEGAAVVINYNTSKSGASKLLREVRTSGGEGMIVAADVADYEQVKRMVRKTLAKYGRIDILVNNAGVMIPETFLEGPDDVWDKTIDVNLKGTYLCSKAVAPTMLKQKQGKIINISSNSGLYHPSAMRFVEYVASKAGVNGLTKALALKLGPYVNVNAICPGWIKTDMVAATDPEVEKRILDETPLKRYGTVEEVANAAVYLASNESDFVTGELHLVAGGRGMH